MSVRPKEAAHQPLMNERIRFESLQVIDDSGENRGVMSRDEAPRLSRAANLDLVISPSVISSRRAASSGVNALINLIPM